jgi:hypothetical protein
LPVPGSITEARQDSFVLNLPKIMAYVGSRNPRWKTLVGDDLQTVDICYKLFHQHLPMPQCRLQGVRLTASIQPSGTVRFGGADCVTLSAAGAVARKSVLSTPPSEPPPATNGWTFWQFRDSKTGNLRDMDSLRQDFLAQKK